MYCKFRVVLTREKGVSPPRWNPLLLAVDRPLKGTSGGESEAVGRPLVSPTLSHMAHICWNPVYTIYLYNYILYISCTTICRFRLKDGMSWATTFLQGDKLSRALQPSKIQWSSASSQRIVFTKTHIVELDKQGNVVNAPKSYPALIIPVSLSREYCWRYSSTPFGRNVGKYTSLQTRSCSIDPVGAPAPKQNRRLIPLFGDLPNLWSSWG